MTLDPHTPTRARTNDHVTSQLGAVDVAKRAPNQRERLLLQFAKAPVTGLTDEQAAHHADLLTACYWKRCGELRKEGLIAETADARKGRAGVLRTVSKITADGKARAQSIREAMR